MASLRTLDTVLHTFYVSDPSLRRHHGAPSPGMIGCCFHCGLFKLEALKSLDIVLVLRYLSSSLPGAQAHALELPETGTHKAITKEVSTFGARVMLCYGGVPSRRFPSLLPSHGHSSGSRRPLNPKAL